MNTPYNPYKWWITWLLTPAGQTSSMRDRRVHHFHTPHLQNCMLKVVFEIFEFFWNIYFIAKKKLLIINSTVFFAGKMIFILDFLIFIVL